MSLLCCAEFIKFNLLHNGTRILQLIEHGIQTFRDNGILRNTMDISDNDSFEDSLYVIRFFPINKTDEKQNLGILIKVINK